MKRNKGFTLIELLVVIAIIGILSSVVLASLNSARDKGKDAAVKAQLAGMKAQGELFYSTAETYTGVCAAANASNGFGGTAGPGLLKAASDSSAISNTIGVTLTTEGGWNITTCHDTTESWAAEAPMNDSVSSSVIRMYCVDSTGYSGLKSVALAASATACN